jgi:nucleoside 2-deoxyribosyltransferase
MIDERSAAEAAAADGAAWIYLISTLTGLPSEGTVRESVREVCEEGGWPIVGWPTDDSGRNTDTGHLFEDVRHAVEHADCVIALLGESGGTADAELALAYSHRRPVIGLRLMPEDSPASAVQAMLGDYERARVVSCQDPEDCGVRVRAVLSDPDFGATIRQAVGERAAAP